MKKNLYILAIVGLFLQSCNAQTVKEPTLPKEYEACCGVQPVDFKLGKHSIYVPNVFTPNGDGINDMFYPFVSAEIGEVQSYQIFSAVGDTVLFQRPTVVYSRLGEFAWNGRRNNGATSSTLYRGKFKYRFRVVSKDYQVRFVEGEACSILCEPGTKDLKVKKGCFFPSQAGKANNVGKLDSTTANGEKDCLK